MSILARQLCFLFAASFFGLSQQPSWNNLMLYVGAFVKCIKKTRGENIIIDRGYVIRDMNAQAKTILIYDGWGDNWYPMDCFVLA